MAFGMRLALASALVSYLCIWLKMIEFLVRCAKPYNRYFGEHLLYAWFVYHCQSKAACPFYKAVANRSYLGLSLNSLWRIVNNFRSYDFRKRPVVD